MAEWCTVAQVLDITGKTVTESELAQAQFVISLYADRDPSALALNSITARDQYWLKLATACQAPWQAAQPGYMDQLQTALRTDQDGADVTRPDESSILLAPLARRAIINLSWKRSRSRLLPRTGARPGGIPDPLAEADDDRMNWQAL